MLINHKRNPHHTIEQRVDNVVDMFKRLEMKYIFPSSYKKQILQMSLIEPKVKILECVWKIVQRSPNNWTNKSFDNLLDIFKEHWRTCFLKNTFERITMFYVSTNL